MWQLVTNRKTGINSCSLTNFACFSSLEINKTKKMQLVTLLKNQKAQHLNKYFPISENKNLQLYL